MDFESRSKPLLGSAGSRRLWTSPLAGEDGEQMAGNRLRPLEAQREQEQRSSAEGSRPTPGSQSLNAENHSAGKNH